MKQLIQKFYIYFFRAILIMIVVVFVFWQINKEIKILTADYYWYKLLSARWVDNDFFTANVLYGYIQDLKIRDNYYQKQYALLLSDWVPRLDDYNPVYRFAAEREAKKILKNFHGNLNRDKFIKAKIYILLANENKPDYFNKAEDILRELIKTSPNLPKYYLAIGELYAKKGNFEKALNNYNKTLKLLPSLNDKRVNRLHKENIKYEQYLVYQNLGKLYLKQKQYKEAAKYYKLAYNNNLADIILLKRIADTYYLQNNFDKAIWYNKRGWIRDPQDYVWPYLIAILYKEKGDKKTAKEYAQKSLELAPNKAKEEIYNFIKELRVYEQ